MSNYIDKDYILTIISEEKLANLTKDEGSDTTNLDANIAKAQSIAEGYLAKRVSVIPIPGAKVPESVKDAVCNITIFKLHSRIQYKDIPDWVKDNYNATMDWLKDVAKGIVELNIEEDETEEIKGDVTYSTNPPLFNRGSF